MMNGFFKVTDMQMDSLCGTELEPVFFWSRRFEYPFALKYAEKGDVVLDAACGTYHPLKFALSDRCTTYACDIVDADINDRIIFTKCSVADLPYKDAMFDKVFCISSLEHMAPETIKAAVSEFWRVMKPGGKLILTIDHPTLDPQLLLHILSEAGFDTGDSDFDMENAVSSTYFGGLLRCYHVTAQKPEGL